MFGAGLPDSVIDTISLRDDRPPATKPHASALTNSAVESVPLERSASYPIYVERLPPAAV